MERSRCTRGIANGCEFAVLSPTLGDRSSVAEIHLLVRSWIVDILKRNESVVAVALRQRAKFEGWLKFELAAHAGDAGATAVQVETSSPDDQSSSRGRSDLSFVFDGVRYDLELKTPNCNWRLPGVDACTRPITKNIADIVSDGRKLAGVSDHGLVAFVLFPLPVGDARWEAYLERIAGELATPLGTQSHTTRLTMPVSASYAADLVVCCFPTTRAQRPPEGALPPS